jgi:hypothetical protein
MRVLVVMIAPFQSVIYLTSQTLPANHNHPCTTTTTTTTIPSVPVDQNYLPLKSFGHKKTH